LILVAAAAVDDIVATVADALVDCTVAAVDCPLPEMYLARLALGFQTVRSGLAIDPCMDLWPAYCMPDLGSMVRPGVVVLHSFAASVAVQWPCSPLEALLVVPSLRRSVRVYVLVDTSLIFVPALQ